MSHWIKRSLKFAVLGLCPLSAAFSSAATLNQKALGDFFNIGFLLGSVYEDKNANGKRDIFEKGLADIIVYLDENDNGQRDSEELFVKTSSAGTYLFSPLPAGNYVVRQEVPFGWENISGGASDSVVKTVVHSSSQSRSKDSNTVTPKIIGGGDTTVSEYPFMVSVGYNFDGYFGMICGGSLIADRWVLTAGHCSVGFGDPSEMGVLIGTDNVFDGSGQILAVSEIIVHPEFAAFPSVSNGYDVALWKLAEPIDLEASNLHTISMLTEDNAGLAADGVLATAIGWGVNDTQSPLLQEVHLPVYNTEECEMAYGSSNFHTQICAGAPEGGIDACQGDSGGPLVVRDPQQDTWKLAGVTSYGNGCALPGFPGVWARVSALSDWVKDNATSASRFHTVKVRRFGIAVADFGNSEVSNEEEGKPIEPRWQLVNTALEHDEVEGLSFNFRIIDEAFAPRTFNCVADGDGAGALPGVADDCYSGENTLTVPPVEDGIYYPSLTASLGGTEYTRSSPMIVGIPEITSMVDGELTVDDVIDPDYFDSYFIDYFDIQDLTGDKAIAIQVTSNSIDALYVGLYDRDFREEFGSGGQLQSAFTLNFGETAEFIFIPDANINYLLGVSTWFSEVTGDYTVTILNEGTAVPTTLGEPTMMKSNHIELRKFPELKSVVRYPKQAK